MGTTGTFPEGVQYLKSLEFLHLSYGQLRGPLPVFLSRLTNLTRVELQGNAYTGTIPNQWYEEWGQLYHLNLMFNQLTGTISSNIDKLQQLQDLFFESNSFTGSIPTTIGGLKNVMSVSFAGNMLTGPIPTTIGNLGSLNTLHLSSNFLTGSLPSEISNLHHVLEDLLVEDNPFLSGELPESLFELTKLEWLRISKCGFSGSISTNIGQLTKLRQLLVRDNRFSGTLPTELGLLNDLTKSDFAGNDFVGAVPDEFCKIPLMVLEKEWLLEADCRQGTNNDGVHSLSCPDGCCTSCCQPGGTDCLPNPLP